MSSLHLFCYNYAHETENRFDRRYRSRASRRRAYDIQAEVNQLKEEIDRTSNDTKFNKIELLKNNEARKIQVGADANQTITINLSKMDATTLSVNNLTIEGSAAITNIEAAIQKVSSYRSDLGAVQNRLEHTIANLDNVVENTTAAESQIRDTDMATEMVKYSNNNILAQAGQAMLAQANQANQGVLSLLG